MSTVEIRMPEEQEGTEAAIAAWLKQPGDAVQENEPLVEVSTDKVTLEIPSPASGILRTHTVQPGVSVTPGDLLGTIETQAEGTETDSVPTPAPAPSASPAAPTSTASQQPVNSADPDQGTTFSPVVRRLLAELKLDPGQIAKSTRGGRITPQDVAAYLTSTASAKPAAPAPAPTSARPGRLIPHTSMRRSIASHMARSVQVAPHVTSIFEADLFHIMADRERRKSAGDAAAVPSVTAYIIHAAIRSIAKFPEVNSRWHDDHVEIYDHVNFGVGTAIEAGGLVVPVLHDAHQMDLLTLSNRLRELTLKARAGKLTLADMAEGTFTLSNHGVSGSLLAAPIVLPHGQAAILGTGKLQKRVVVCENGGRDLFRVRPMMYVTLTVDHRVLDGQQTNGFLTDFVATLEQPPTA